jgi:hypothetical protein
VEECKPLITDGSELIKKPIIPFKNLSELWQLIYPYLLLQWDGLSFFGFDDTKLARLRGAPVTFFSKFSSVRWIIFTMGSMVAAVVILTFEVGKYGSVRSKEISLIQSDFYSYNATDGLAVMLVHWFYLNELIPRAQTFWEDN